MQLLLRSPLHRLLSSHLLLLSFADAKSGRRRTLPIAYARHGGRLVLVAGHAGEKRWWRSFREEAPVRVRVAGVERAARARVLPAESEEAADALAAYRAAVPHAARGLVGGDDGDVAVVVVEIDGESC
jgi:deazaflavin-dependent oxidoreductase (nitroreductase family)